ncbi:MAG: hypothetical protein B6243_11310, partial [Anaerolineaceae bacterium 4572_5.2]
WEIYPRAPEAHLAQFFDVPRLVTQILYNRGVFRSNEVHQFIDAVSDSDDPFLMKGITEAVDEIFRVIETGGLIVVYGDYDADGVTSTTLMTQALQALGARAEPYIPDRFDEGYGLNKQAIAELAKKGAALIVTVDCGIRSAEEVAYGNDLGLKFRQKRPTAPVCKRKTCLIWSPSARWRIWFLWWVKIGRWLSEACVISIVRSAWG